jgi:hypothetical protein
MAMREAGTDDDGEERERESVSLIDHLVHLRTSKFWPGRDRERQGHGAYRYLAVCQTLLPPLSLRRTCTLYMSRLERLHPSPTGPNHFISFSYFPIPLLTCFSLLDSDLRSVSFSSFCKMYPSIASRSARTRPVQRHLVYPPPFRPSGRERNFPWSNPRNSSPIAGDGQCGASAQEM